MNHIKIVQNGRRTVVEMDGVKVHGVTELSYHNSIEEMPTLCIKLIPESIEINIAGASHSEEYENAVVTDKEIERVEGRYTL